jgi:hypothetical protein
MILPALCGISALLWGSNGRSVLMGAEKNDHGTWQLNGNTLTGNGTLIGV